MFGYVKPYKPALRICEYGTYKSIYCGLCKELGNRGKRFKLILSYDLTFFSLIHLAIQEEEPEFENRKCMASPFKNKTFLKHNQSLELSSKLAILLAYYKLKDDINDEKWFKKLVSYFGLMFTKSQKKKALYDLSNVGEILDKMYQEQNEVEKGEFISVDNSQNPFANAMSEVFGTISNEKEKSIPLKRMGYMIGRYIYIMDAFNDLEEDFKKNKYNPLLKKFNIEDKNELKNENIKIYVEQQLNVTIAQAAAAYELLPIKRYKPIIDNIIYYGLKAQFNELVLKNNKSKPKREYAIENKKEAADERSI